jgi:hypothetical protein
VLFTHANVLIGGGSGGGVAGFGFGVRIKICATSPTNSARIILRALGPAKGSKNLEGIRVGQICVWICLLV